MHATVRRNLAKRKAAEPWSLETSTMYLPGENSVAELAHDLAKQIGEGKAKANRLLFDHRQADGDVDLSDEAELRSALHEVYGPFAEVMDLDRIVNEIWDFRNDPQDSRRYFLNQPTSSSDAWITSPEWLACLDVDKVISPSDPIALGFDGSRKRSRGVTDATALIGCRVSDGHLFEIGVWEQPSGPAGNDWEVPTAQVDAAVRGAFTNYNVVAFFADPALWESYVAAWEAAYASKLKVKSTQLHAIQWWMNRPIVVVRALEQFHSAVVDGEISHDGSSALTRHVLNARRRKSKAGLQIAKEHPDSPNKIDAAVAATLSFQARLAAVAAGLGTQRPRRIARRLN